MTTTDYVLADIRAHAEAAYPQECCGYLLGTLSGSDSSVDRILRGSNHASGPRSRSFLLTPRSYRHASRVAEEDALDVVGFYHSHPDHPARPSPTDLQEASFPGYRYVIVAVESGSATEITAWSLAENRSRFVRDPIEVRPLTNQFSTPHE